MRRDHVGVGFRPEDGFRSITRTGVKREVRFMLRGLIARLQRPNETATQQQSSANISRLNSSLLKTNFNVKGFRMRSWLASPCLLGLILATGVSGSSAFGQTDCVRYRIEPKTVYKEYRETFMRDVVEEVPVEQEIVEYKDVWVTETSEKVSYKPIFETSEKMETRKVWKQIQETAMETRTRNYWEDVQETEVREQVRLVPKTVIETKVVEQQHVERVPVTRTVNQQEMVTTLRPVTSYQTQLINQPTVVNQQYYQPGTVSNSLKWMRPAYYNDPVTGQLAYQRRGLHWVPTQQPGSIVNVPTVVPNVVTQQVPVTNYVPETVVQNRPVQVTEYVDQVTTQRVPYEVQRTDYVQEVEKIPVTVSKPVLRTVEEQVPVTKTRWIEVEETVPVTTQTLKYERIATPVSTQVLKRIPETKKVTVMTKKVKQVPYDRVYKVPSTVYYRIPVDANGNPIQIQTAKPIESLPATAGKEAAPAAATSTPADQKPGLKQEEVNALKLNSAEGADSK